MLDEPGQRRHIGNPRPARLIAVAGDACAGGQSAGPIAVPGGHTGDRRGALRDGVLVANERVWTRLLNTCIQVGRQTRQTRPQRHHRRTTRHQVRRPGDQERGIGVEPVGNQPSTAQRIQLGHFSGHTPIDHRELPVACNQCLTIVGGKTAQNSVEVADHGHDLGAKSTQGLRRLGTRREGGRTVLS